MKQERGKTPDAREGQLWGLPLSRVARAVALGHPGQDPRREASPGKDSPGRGDSCEGQGAQAPAPQEGREWLADRMQKGLQAISRRGVVAGRGPSRAAPPGCRHSAEPACVGELLAASH